MPKKKVDHAKRDHADLSASSSERWLKCPPSAMLTKDMPDVVSPYAKEGTRAHEIAEANLSTFLAHGVLTLNNEKTFKEIDDQRIYEEVYPYIEQVVEDFKALKEEHEDAVLFLETRVDFSKWVPGGFGTADCIMIAGNTIYVRDLKFGKGVTVFADNNSQARCYGLGALEAYGDLYDIDIVVNQIHQPRLDHFSEERITKKDLMNWANKTLKPIAKLAAEGKGEFTPGEHCRFCKASATCRARADYALSLDPLMDIQPNLLSNEEISEVLTKAENIGSWVKSVKEYVTSKLLEGDIFPGWKVVEGRSIRKWVDDLKVAERMKNNGYDEALIYTKKLNGLTEMKKLCGGEKKMEELLGDLIIKPQGAPTLVPEDDKRPAMQGSAITDFDGISE